MFSKRTCCIVTGASQGLGACIAEHFINKLSEDSVVIRLSRNVQKMEAMQFSNPSVKTILCAKYDQSNIDEKYFDSLLVDICRENNIKTTDFQQAVMVHNAGDLGDISKFTSEMSDAATVRHCFDVNCKAAREMFFKTVAVEFPRTRVLNYSPGPCDTDMQERCRTETADTDIQSYFKMAHKEGKLLSPDTSISKMMDVLKQNKYNSGDHVDYYDEL
ncbi:hypothetical protein FSP39_011577 [Pinctada imbricata]|uniref:Sepiapterin reductase n=1 Tax=Pinctada imbricata TaxID=66713 RepID=A0AA89CAS2_PINIB|nr:hypothetical protein FSP39_011577 [Pinctada imbricata]